MKATSLLMLNIRPSDPRLNKLFSHSRCSKGTDGLISQLIFISYLK